MPNVQTGKKTPTGGYVNGKYAGINPQGKDALVGKMEEG